MMEEGASSLSLATSPGNFTWRGKAPGPACTMENLTVKELGEQAGQFFYVFL